MAIPVSESKDSLLLKIASLEAEGQTACGPAILTSLGLLSQGQKGSIVIVCTDGLSNIGLGALD